MTWYWQSLQADRLMCLGVLIECARNRSLRETSVYFKKNVSLRWQCRPSVCYCCFHWRMYYSSPALVVKYERAYVDTLCESTPKSRLFSLQSFHQIKKIFIRRRTEPQPPSLWWFESWGYPGWDWWCEGPCPWPSQPVLAWGRAGLSRLVLPGEREEGESRALFYCITG